CGAMNRSGAVSSLIWRAFNRGRPWSARFFMRRVSPILGTEEYLRAKAEQHEIARELESLEVDRAQLGTRLGEAEGEVNSYQEWCRIKAELTALEAEWLPRVELAELMEVVQRGRTLQSLV
ncbi:MAG: hypothetical protein ACREVS_02415, partial [Burkholderiales bacterium]